MVATRRTKRTMTLRNFTTHTLHTRLMIRVDIGNRKCTSMNPVIHYRKDSRRNRLSRTLKKSLTTLPRSSPLLLGSHGACIAEQHNPATSAYWSFLKIGVLGVCGHGDINKVAAFGHRCTHFSNCVGGNVIYVDVNIHGYEFREAGRDVSVASFAAPSSSRYSLSHPFLLPSPWCVCLPCLLNFSSFLFPVDTTPRYRHWR
jgi:hypothetical protein